MERRSFIAGLTALILSPQVRADECQDARTSVTTDLQRVRAHEASAHRMRSTVRSTGDYAKGVFQEAEKELERAEWHLDIARLRKARGGDDQGACRDAAAARARARAGLFSAARDPRMEEYYARSQLVTPPKTAQKKKKRRRRRA